MSFEESVFTTSWDCEFCPMGYAQPSIGSTMCDNCPMGFSSNAGQVSCDFACRKGTYRALKTYPEWMANSYANSYASLRKLKPEDICLACPRGFSSSGNTDSSKNELMEYFGECLPCIAGRFQNLKGQEICLDCNIGTEATELGKPVCSTCMMGTYQNEAGQPRCKECESGLFNPPATINGTVSYFPTNPTKCEVCATGQWTSGDDGLGRLTEKKTTMSTQTISKIGWHSCTNCPAGRFGNTNILPNRIVNHQLRGVSFWLSVCSYMI